MSGSWIRSASDDATVVFVHGILSNSDKCWTHDNGTSWPRLLRDEAALATVGIYEFDYRADALSRNYTLNDVVDSLREHMRLDGILPRQTIIFVCHSLGGIAVRRYIVQRQNDFIERGTNLALFLVASPSLGSEYANFADGLTSVFGNSHLRLLRCGESNEWLTALDTDFMNLKESNRLRLCGKELLEDQFFCGRWLWFFPKVVPAFSGARYFGEHVKIDGSDHSSIAKPADNKAFQHRLLCQFIRDRLDERNLPWTQQEATHAADSLRKLAASLSANRVPTEHHAAIRRVHHALTETRRYLKRRSEAGYRDQAVEQRLSELWNEAGHSMLEFNADLANLCWVKGHGWADNTVWDQPEFKDLPLRLNDILARILAEGTMVAR